MYLGGERPVLAQGLFLTPHDAEYVPSKILQMYIHRREIFLREVWLASDHFFVKVPRSLAERKSAVASLCDVRREFHVLA